MITISIELEVVDYRGAREIRAEIPYKVKDLAKQIEGYTWRDSAKKWAWTATPVMAYRIASSTAFWKRVTQWDDAFDDLLERGTHIIDGDDTQHDLDHGTDPWDHQKEAIQFMMNRHAGMLHMEMGTGKSLCVVDWFQNKSDTDKLIIVCPKSAMNVWPREFRTHAHDQFPYRISVNPDDSVSDRIDDAKATFERAESMDEDAVAVFNYATVRKDKAKRLIKKTGEKNNLSMVADESHRIKAPGSQQSMAFRTFHNYTQYRFCLTGTPMPHSPLDLYGQFRFLDQGVFGTRFKRFRSNYAIMGGYDDKEVIGFKNEDELAERMGWLTYRAGEEVMDLPEAHTVDRYVKLPPDAQEKYNSLENRFWAQVEDGEVTARNGLAKMLRLQQVTSGYVTDDNDNDREIHNEKNDLLEEMLQNTDDQVVVFARFREDLSRIRDVVEGLDLRYGEVSGEASDIDDDAEMPKDIDVMGVQIQAGAEGIDLTRANVGIYYSMGFSLGNYRQSRRRLHRPGQEDTVRFFRIVADGTIDEKVIGALEDKQDIVDHILSLNNTG